MCSSVIHMLCSPSLSTHLSSLPPYPPTFPLSLLIHPPFLSPSLSTHLSSLPSFHSSLSSHLPPYPPTFPISSLSMHLSSLSTQLYSLPPYPFTFLSPSPPTFPLSHLILPPFLSPTHLSFCPSLHFVQHGTADVSLMLLGAKSDLEGRREVTTEEGRKVQSYMYSDVTWLNVQ